MAHTGSKVYMIATHQLLRFEIMYAGDCFTGL